MKIAPKVSIIIPCYNAEKYIANCVYSCVGQTYPNIEIIVVDNESTDNSFFVIQELKKQYPFLIIDKEKNIYKYSWQEPVEKAFTLMTGYYFTIVGADDLILPTYIEECVNRMQQKNLSAMQSALLCFDRMEGTNVVVNHVYGGFHYKNIEELKFMLLKFCAVASPSVFYKTSILKDYKFEMKSHLYLGACDYYLYCSLVDQGIFIHPFKETLGYCYRSHAEQSTNGMMALPENNIDFSIKSEFTKKWSSK